jgi:phytoene/squalene synthetase
MASNYETFHGPAAAADSTLASRKNSYSRKRRSTFDAWQEHVRKSAAAVGVAFSARHDRDLRRATISG